MKCPKCQAPMKLRKGKYGHFWGCQGFPECRGTRQFKAEDAEAGSLPCDLTEECDWYGCKFRKRGMCPLLE